MNSNPLPNSAEHSYAQLLNKDFKVLQFPETVENEYRQIHLARCRNRVRLWQTFLVATALIYGICRLKQGALGGPAPTFEMLLRFAVLVPAWAVLAWLAWSSRYEALYWPVARILVPVTGCLAALLVTVLIVNGRGEALSGLTTHMLGLMFLSGVLFRQGVWICVAMMLIFAGAAVHEGMTLAKLFFDSVSPLMTVGIGGFVYYEMEKNARRSFLEQKIALEQASSDGLTGLKNRRTFDEHLRRIWQHANVEGRQLGLLLIDVDEFKRYNDRYGHQAGDRCLQRISQIVQDSTLRPLDLAARFGGEELAVILYDIDANQLKHTAKEIRAAVEKLAIEHRDSTGAPLVTVSIGAACIKPESARSREGLVQLADEALYDAKRRGRNRVTLRENEYQFLSTGMFRNPGLPPESPPGAW